MQAGEHDDSYRGDPCSDQASRDEAERDQARGDDANGHEAE